MLKITDCCLHSHAAPLPGHVSARAGPGPGDHAADPGRVLGHADKHVREARLGAAGAEGGHTHQVPAAVLILVSNMIIYVHISISTYEESPENPHLAQRVVTLELWRDV